MRASHISNIVRSRNIVHYLQVIASTGLNSSRFT